MSDKRGLLVGRQAAPVLTNREVGMPRLSFEVELNESLHRELVERCQLCRCSPKQYAAESLEVTLAGIRLPRVELGAHGPQLSPRGSGQEVEPETAEEAGLTVHRILL
jgi:hypothetical protein